MEKDENGQSGEVVARDRSINEEGKMSKNAIIGIIILTIIAIAGVAFGIFGMMQKNNSVADLKVQIKNEDGTTTTIETPKIETTTVNGDTTVTITDSNITTENPEDYVYLGDWDLKIKIGDELEVFQLTHYVDDDCEDYSFLTVNPEQKSVISQKYGVAVDNGDIFPQVFLERCAKADAPQYHQLEPLFSDDGEYVYYIHSSSGAIFEYYGEAGSYISEANAKMIEILEDLNNYSKI